MKAYVSDAVAFLHYLLDDLASRADAAFREAERGEAVIYLPTIAAAELFYLFEKKGWRESALEMERRMKEEASFRYYPFDRRVLEAMRVSKAKEIHDRIIIATARVVGAEALITKDDEIRRVKETRTIW